MASGETTMKAALDDFGRSVPPQQVQDDLDRAGESFVMEDGVLLFTGELEEDPDLVIQRGREERARKVAGLD
jgi:hypothetical protein